jgi:antitoxin component HigA of HigAB toxin-antitoxin module
MSDRKLPKIKTRKAYCRKLAEAILLMDKNPKRNSKDGKRLRAIATVIEEYEIKHFRF